MYPYQNLHPGLVKFIKLLDDPYNLSLPLNDLIAQTGFSYPHINRLFHSEMNTSAGKYFQQKKINHAEALLRNTDKTITAISESLGFFSPAQFSLFFKNKTGISPSRYRNSKSQS